MTKNKPSPNEKEYSRIIENQAAMIEYYRIELRYVRFFVYGFGAGVLFIVLMLYIEVCL